MALEYSQCAWCNRQLPTPQLERLTFDRMSILLCPTCGELALGALAIACDEIARAAPFGRVRERN